MAPPVGRRAPFGRASSSPSSAPCGSTAGAPPAGSSGSSAAATVGIDGTGADARTFVQLGPVVIGYAASQLLVSRRLTMVAPLGLAAALLALYAIGCAPAALRTEPSRLPPGGAFGSIAVLGVVCTAGAFLIFFALTAQAGPVRAPVITHVPGRRGGLGRHAPGRPLCQLHGDRLRPHP